MRAQKENWTQLFSMITQLDSVVKGKEPCQKASEDCATGTGCTSVPITAKDDTASTIAVPGIEEVAPIEETTTMNKDEGK